MSKAKIIIPGIVGSSLIALGILNLPSSGPTKETAPSLQLSTANPKAKEILQKIDDYSFKLFMPCGVGTGWILDYIIPEDGSYPTTWFIATNAHVVSKYKFQEKSFDQEIPDTKKGLIKVPSYVKMDYSNVNLFTDVSCSLATNYGFNGFNLSKESIGKQFNSNRDGMSMKQIKAPKLFYVPTNFLGNRNYNYQKDFAVLEIQFENADIAEKLTKGFHHKYSKGNGLNLFDNDLLTKRQKGDSYLNNRYYSFAYPTARGKTFEASNNYDERNDRASALTYTHPAYGYLDGNELLRGYANSGALERTSWNSKTLWNNKTMHNIGHHYVVDNMHMTGGSSGGIFTDQNGNILGLNRLHDPEHKHAFIEPLRSEGVYVNGVEVLPKYDLIRGVEGQVSSFKSQLDKFYKGKKTFLRSQGLI